MLPVLTEKKTAASKSRRVYIFKQYYKKVDGIMFSKKCTICDAKVGGLFGKKNYGTSERVLCQKCAAKEQLERERPKREQREREQRERELRETHNKELIVENKLELSNSALAMINKGISIIEKSVELKTGYTVISGAGSEGIVIEAAKYFETACKEINSSPVLHYAYCSALHIASQFVSARIEMEELLKRHPNYSLAKWAIAGWDSWKSIFNLPPWYNGIDFVHQIISQEVISCVLLPVRDKYIPRATLFLKDQGGDLDIEALQSAKIEITAILDNNLNVPVFGILARIWDNPKDSFNLEAHSLPLGKRGRNFRMACEYITRQTDIDFVVLSKSNKILLNRRISMPDRMMDSLYKLDVLLMDRIGDEKEYTPFEIQKLMNSFQNKYEAANVAY